MANLTGANTEGLNIWDWNQWGFDHLVSATGSVYEYETPAGYSVVITGSGFTYDKSGDPLSGTVETVSIYDDFGNQIASLVLGDAPLTDLVANNFHDFWSVLLAGDDILALGGQDDTVSAHDGDDIVFGGAGDDNIFGGEGNDIIDGDGGDDYVNAGNGDDTIYFDAEEGNDIIEGGLGNDTVVHRGLNGDWPDFIYIEKASEALEIVEQPVDFEPAYQFFAGQDSSEIQSLGTRQTDPFKAFAVEEPEGETFGYKVDEGRDTDGTFGGSKTIGHDGPEEYDDVQIRAGSFTNTDDPQEPDRTKATIREVEQIEVLGRDGNDNLYVDNLAGTLLENGHITFDGGAGEDDLHAGSTTTAVTYQWRWVEGEGDAGKGNVDFGSNTQDVFHFIDETNDGHRLSLGENGADVEIWEGISGYGVDEDISINGAEFLDFDFGGGDDDFIVDFDLSGVYSGVLDVNFGEGDALLDAGAHTGRIEAIGGDDHNAFFSGSGDDLLVGGASYDDIFGGDGDDEIIAGAGDDDIGGGEGNDTIEGGAGFDRFFFEENSGTDMIIDFEDGIDILDYTGFGGTIEYADLTINQLGDDTYISGPGGETVILQGVQAATIDNSDFLI